jgi:hypothetical protein
MYFRPDWDGGFLQGLEKFAKNAGRNPALVLRQTNSAMKIVPFDNENIRQKNIVLHLCSRLFHFSSVLPGVCSTDQRLDTSTNGLKQVYTSLEAFY